MCADLACNDISQQANVFDIRNHSFFGILITQAYDMGHCFYTYSLLV